MIVMKFYHKEQELHFDNNIYKATCKVRNEINKRRRIDEIVKSLPLSGNREPYYPRKFPTGAWKVKKPIWTNDIDYWPVKIPTNARRAVFTWTTKDNKYHEKSGSLQIDSFYHLHFAKNSSTTLGCIRLDSKDDAERIAKKIEYFISKDNQVWLEVFVSKD